MCLILQEIRVQVQVLKLCKSIQESSEEVLFIKSRQMYLSRFNIWSSTNYPIAASNKNYEIQISRYVFHAYPSYLCRVFFLTTLDIYKDYFQGRQRWCNLMQSDYSLKLWLETIYRSSSFSWRSCYICTPRILQPMSFFIFIVWMNKRTLQPTSFSSWCVSHILWSVHQSVSHVLEVVHWNERLSLH